MSDSSGRPYLMTGGTTTLLTEEQLQSLAERCAEHVVRLLRRGGDRSAPSSLVDAESVAALLSVSRDWVYAHADDLGAVRIGGGPRGRLRFDRDRALAAATPSSTRKGSQRAKPPSAGRSRRRGEPVAGSGATLLPITGPVVELFADEGP